MAIAENTARRGAMCAAVASIWIVTLVIGQYLRADMEAAISAQQHSTVS